MAVSGVEVQLRCFLRSAAILATWHRELVQKYGDERQNKRRLAHSNVLYEVATTSVCLSVRGLTSATKPFVGFAWYLV